nr:Fur family transcriptional regulator [Leifsonia sp. Leaf325]
MLATHHGASPSTGQTSDAADPHEDLHHEAPETSVELALAALRSRGERVTIARRAVLDVLARTHEYVSADHVVSMLADGTPVVHRATVYRTLDVLSNRGIVAAVHVPGGATMYHFAAGTPGHEHLHAHCRVCRRVVVIPADSLDVAAERILDSTGLAIGPMQSVIVGVCAQCAEADQSMSTKTTSIALLP